MTAPLSTPERQHRFPAIPEPQPSLESLVQVCNALKEAIELLSGQRQRGREMNAFPTWGDLVNIGVATPDQVEAWKTARLLKPR